MEAYWRKPAPLRPRIPRMWNARTTLLLSLLALAPFVLAACGKGGGY